MIFGPSDAEFQEVFEGTKKCRNNDPNKKTQTEDLSYFMEPFKGSMAILKAGQYYLDRFYKLNIHFVDTVLHLPE